MIVTTTPNVEGRRIVEYCGVVAGEAIMGGQHNAGFYGQLSQT